ncbi:class II aldolase/adducin family protein [Candidatus Omnitrophota bacterium]
MHERQLHNFLKMSKYAGERFDLTQAGGGNTSAQLDDGNMLIKASGCLLSDITDLNGYLEVNKTSVLALLDQVKSNVNLSKRKQDDLVAREIVHTIIKGAGRPSIETFLHTLLYKYTLHTHPIAVNCLTASPSWKEKLETLFPDAAFVTYQSPGFSLALAVKKEIDAFHQTHQQKPHICFLQNHGLIISCDDADQVIQTSEAVLKKIEQQCGINLTAFKHTNHISSLMKAKTRLNLLCFHVCDPFITESLSQHKEYFFSKPFCPDTLVYCGVVACELDFHDQQNCINEYINKYHDAPKVIIFEDNVYLMAPSIHKARQMEELLKFHLMVLTHNNGNVTTLSDDEIHYLSNWEAEKYRQEI